jgi:hypothetical protein
MSPEMELLDQLLGGAEPLWLALRVFGWPECGDAVERARHSIMMQVHDGLIEIIDKARSSDQVLQVWEVRRVLEDEANWLRQGDARYFLRLTDKGVQYVS